MNTPPTDALVERLRKWSNWHSMGDEMKRLFLEAADRIQTLEAALAAEREACASLAAAWTSSLHPGSVARLYGHQDAAREIAAAIRARSIQDRVG